MGLEYFVSEPAPAAMDLMEKLCDEYGISIAIHNHPKPSSVYWDPEKIVEVTRGRRIDSAPAATPATGFAQG